MVNWQIVVPGPLWSDDRGLLIRANNKERRAGPAFVGVPSLPIGNVAQVEGKVPA
jgi:hypothetical protein